MSIAKIRVATYNVGDYTGMDVTHGSEESREAFTAVLKKTQADLWAFQEDVEFFNKDEDDKYTHSHPYDEDMATEWAICFLTGRFEGLE